MLKIFIGTFIVINLSIAKLEQIWKEFGTNMEQLGLMYQLVSIKSIVLIKKVAKNGQG